MYQFLPPTLVIKDPDLVKQITVKEFDQFVNRRQLINAESAFWSRNNGGEDARSFGSG
jgi:cytochrome P450 family 9